MELTDQPAYGVDHVIEPLWFVSAIAAISHRPSILYRLRRFLRRDYRWTRYYWQQRLGFRKLLTRPSLDWEF